MGSLTRLVVPQNAGWHNVDMFCREANVAAAAATAAAVTGDRRFWCRVSVLQFCYVFEVVAKIV